MVIEAAFVRSAASAVDLPRDGLAEIALVGRSNVGKSSLINALVRQRVARTSAAPGKTRLANIYRVARSPSTRRQAQGRPEPGRGATSPGQAGQPFYLVDLPGYGYARGSAQPFEALTRAYFGRPRVSAFFLVDARHPGLENDLQAWRWLFATVENVAVVATKIDKLARGERIRALKEFESVFESPALPVSAVTGEGMDDLWKLIAQQLTSA